MRYKKVISLFSAALFSALTLVGCGTPRISDTVIEGTDPDVTRIVAPGADQTPSDTNAVTSGNAGTTGTTAGTTAAVTTAADTTASGNATVQSSDGVIHFIAAGDNIIHENVYTDARNRAKDGQDYDFIDMYTDIADFVKSADLAFVNQETPLGGDELGISGYPNFNGPQAAGKALVDLGFDIVNIATNHMLDKKEAGLKGHIDFWNSQPVTLLGGYYDKDDYENIRVVEKNGIKIAFLTYTYGLNGMTLPASSKLYIPLIDSAEITRMIGKAKNLADMVFVVMHWGTDGSTVVTDEQKSLAKTISEAGADAIIGMHSHTLQPVEWHANPDGSRTLVIYSLGNLISTQYENYTMVGGIMSFDVVKDASGCRIENPVMNPVITHYNADRLGLQVYLFKDYTAELAAAHGTVNYGKDKTFSLDYITKLVKSAISDEFLPDFMK